MSAKDTLPTELANFEARLRQAPLPNGNVDRDELMYRAGWAAAEASRTSNKFWQATSGLLAASVLVMAMMMVNNTDDSLAQTVAKATSDKADEKAETENEQARVEEESFVAREPRRFTRQWKSNAPFLAMRERALRMEFDEPVSYTSTGEVRVPEIVTARELMQEMLGETS